MCTLCLKEKKKMIWHWLYYIAWEVSSHISVWQETLKHNWLTSTVHTWPDTDQNRTENKGQSKNKIRQILRIDPVRLPTWSCLPADQYEELCWKLTFKSRPHRLLLLCSCLCRLYCRCGEVSSQLHELFSCILKKILWNSLGEKSRREVDRKVCSVYVESYTQNMGVCKKYNIKMKRSPRSSQYRHLTTLQQACTFTKLR